IMLTDSYFFFQAEDGIRGFHVTGVQTCALPIYETHHAGGRRDDALRARGIASRGRGRRDPGRRGHGHVVDPLPELRGERRPPLRSEERRVGKEGGPGRARERELDETVMRKDSAG